MNRHDLIELIAVEAGIKRGEAEAALKTTLAAITDALTRGEAVTLIGFGTFEVRHRAGRQARNPKTGEMIDVPPAVVPAFKAGKALKDAVK